MIYDIIYYARESLGSKLEFLNIWRINIKINKL